MKRSGTLKRRTVLAALAAAPAVSCGRRAAAGLRYLTAEESATLAAVCDTLIPPDDAPGGAAAGVVNFLDVQLTKRYRGDHDVYRKGLAALDEYSRQQHGHSFAALPSEQRTAVLGAIERKQGRAEATVFFERVLAHTMQGFYGSPRHGGNRDGMSWKMLGVATPPVRGRHHYEVS